MGKRKTILVVDDEPDAVTFLRTWLEDGGYRALGLTDPREVLKVVRSERPDLLLLDVHMPGNSGVEVYRALVRENGGRPPVVFLTGGGEFELFDRSCHPLPPPAGLLEKPVNLGRLASLLDSLFGSETEG